MSDYEPLDHYVCDERTNDILSEILTVLKSIDKRLGHHSDEAQERECAICHHPFLMKYICFYEPESKWICHKCAIERLRLPKSDPLLPPFP